METLLIMIMTILAITLAAVVTGVRTDDEDTFVDERLGDASIDDDWGLDALDAAAELDQRQRRRRRKQSPKRSLRPPRR